MFIVKHCQQINKEKIDTIIFIPNQLLVSIISYLPLWLFLSDSMNSFRSFLICKILRSFSLRYLWPLISVFCRESAPARNCLDMLSTEDLKFETIINS